MPQISTYKYAYHVLLYVNPLFIIYYLIPRLKIKDTAFSGTKTKALSQIKEQEIQI